MMRTTLAFAIVLTTMPTFAAANRTIDEDHVRQIDRAVAAAFELELTPGAVIVAGHGDGVVFQKAYGKLTYDQDSKPVTLDTDDKRGITIEQLLLHRGGFIADNDIKDYKGTPQQALEKIYTGKLKYKPG